jgi:hypothetical protein
MRATHCRTMMMRTFTHDEDEKAPASTAARQHGCNVAKTVRAAATAAGVGHRRCALVQQALTVRRSNREGPEESSKTAGIRRTADVNQTRAKAGRAAGTTRGGAQRARRWRRRAQRGSATCIARVHGAYRRAARFRASVSRAQSAGTHLRAQQLARRLAAARRGAGLPAGRPRRRRNGGARCAPWALPSAVSQPFAAVCACDRPVPAW